MGVVTVVVVVVVDVVAIMMLDAVINDDFELSYRQKQLQFEFANYLRTINVVFFGADEIRTNGLARKWLAKKILWDSVEQPMYHW